MTLSELSYIENEHVKLKQYLEDTFYLSERIDSFNKNKLYTLEVELLRRCNLECIYCYNSSTRHNTLFIDPAKCKKLISDAVSYGIKEIYWLGGETLLYPHIKDILQFSKHLGLRNVVFTNGTRFNHENVQILNETTDWINLHIDSINSSVFAKLHNLTFEESVELLRSTIDGIDLLLDSGFPSNHIRFSIVLTKLSYSCLSETLSWAIIKKGFHTSTLIPLAALSRGKKVYRQLLCSKRELFNAFKTRSDIENRPELLRLGPSEFCKHYELTNCYIDNKGNIFPYVGISECYGNIYNNSIGKLFDDEYSKISFDYCVDDTSFKNQLVGKCYNCVNQNYCFGTRAYSYLSGDIILSDPCCWE